MGCRTIAEEEENDDDDEEEEMMMIMVMTVIYSTKMTVIVQYIPYILESNPHPNLIRTSFCRFLKRKKKS